MRGISLPGLAYLLNLASVGVFGMRSGTAAFTVFRQRGRGLFCAYWFRNGMIRRGFRAIYGKKALSVNF